MTVQDLRDTLAKFDGDEILFIFDGNDDGETPPVLKVEPGFVVRFGRWTDFFTQADIDRRRRFTKDQIEIVGPGVCLSSTVQQ